ncbi:hypothetical protein QJS04_geneDACA010731 [Acorus gramineus]|uniref:Retrotransposon gag domain-containing protein n=1 Tax=Acorus gramineus TaxID=55184 RepID=A0AAV9BBK8_ACOGR|nr:hypothetical protein QJS04_geneDACA010731 [Acorus gramineus]
MEVEVIFSTMLCTDRQRVSLATFMLKGSAADWWATRVVDIPEGVEQLLWAGFRRYFLEEYFPFSTRQIVMQEFERLTQGSMSVADYSTRFTRLSRFAPALVMDEEARCRRFELGLCSAIRVHVSSQAFSRFSDLVSRAKTVERDLGILVRVPTPSADQGPSGSRDQGQRKRKRPPSISQRLPLLQLMWCQSGIQHPLRQCPSSPGDQRGGAASIVSASGISDTIALMLADPECYLNISSHREVELTREGSQSSRRGVLLLLSCSSFRAELQLFRPRRRSLWASWFEVMFCFPSSLEYICVDCG